MRMASTEEQVRIIHISRLCKLPQRPHSQFAGLSEILSRMTGSRVEFAWTKEHNQAFEALKVALISAPYLWYLRPNDLFILDTDASDVNMGAELAQIQDGQEVVISYTSKILIKDQKKWCTTHKELKIH